MFWGKDEEKEAEKERMWQAQQEILKERRASRAMQEANQKKQKVAAKKQAPRKKAPARPKPPPEYVRTETYVEEGADDGEELDPMEWVKGIFGGKKKAG
eukprot:evm.model.scf_652.3 EVM.evm.TU.scf_652.3   scf_652:57044-59830(+)